MRDGRAAASSATALIYTSAAFALLHGGVSARYSASRAIRIPSAFGSGRSSRVCQCVVGRDAAVRRYGVGWNAVRIGCGARLRTHARSAFAHFHISELHEAIAARSPHDYAVPYFDAGIATGDSACRMSGETSPIVSRYDRQVRKSGLACVTG